MSTPNPLRISIEIFVVGVLAFLLAITPVSSKAINLVWIVLFLLSLWLVVYRWRAAGEVSRGAVVNASLMVLIGWFLLGFFLMVAMKLYWNEPVRGVSFELNASLAAIASWVFANHWLAGSRHRAILGAGLAIASVLAVVQGYGYMVAGNPGPTNAVNWGAGMALFMCIAFSLAASGNASSRNNKLLAGFSVCIFAVAILIAGRRGAFFSILWCGFAGGYLFFRDFFRRPNKAKHLLALAVLLFVVFVGAFLAKEQLAAPIDRVMAGISEVKAIASRDPDRTELLHGSVGSRFHMLELGVETASASPWIGVGADGLARVIKRAELDVQAPLFHLHNEYLQAWVAYGVFGLFAALCFPMGLLVAGVLLRRAAPAPSLAMVSLGLVHFFSGLSNVNTFHNFYGTVFAVCVALPFLMFAPGPKRGRDLPSFARAVQHEPDEVRGKLARGRGQENRKTSGCLLHLAGARSTALDL